jgi:DNA-binding transcriptional LysR family regulator
MNQAGLEELELRHLRVLVALAQEGTFTDAAIEVGLSQPAVSRCLARLEALIGVQLVSRTTRSLELTAAGRAAVPAAVAALAAVDAFIEAARASRLRVRLGYTWAAFGRHTDDILQLWRVEHPDLPIEMRRIDDRTAGLGRGEVDVAIRRGPIEDTGVMVEHLFDEPRFAAVPARSPLAAAVTLRLADLAGATVVLVPGVGTTTLSLWPVGEGPRHTVDVANIDEWLLAISSSGAVGVTPESTAYQHPHPGVRYIPLADAPLVPVSLLTSRAHPHPALAPLAALVRRRVNDEAGLNGRATGGCEV